MPPLYVIQWGIVGFFVAIHFIIGFLRGGSKSTYFSIVSIILTFVTLWLVSKISLNLVFSTFMSLETMINTITGLVGFSIPAEFADYLLDPGLTAFAIAVVDVVLRIVAFIVIYPILKWSLTMTFFRPIWKHGIKKALLKKQNEKAKEAFEVKHENQKFKNSKKLQKPVMGRLMGAFMGAIRGFVVGFVFVLPIIVISSFVSGVNDILVFHQDQTVTLGSNSTELIAIPSEIQNYIDQIVEMNEKGVGAITKDIVIQGKTADRLLFDMVFTTDIVAEGEKIGEISLGQELEGIFGIARILIDGGYLEDSFDFQTISSDNLDDIEAIFGYISNSSLLKSMIPIGTKFAVNSILPDLIDGTNLYDNETTAEALDQFTSIDWSNEFMNLYGIIEAVLEFGSVEELMAYADDPNSILEITPAQATAFTNIIRAFGELETLYVLNAAVDFATSFEEVQNIVSWLEPSEREAYLKQRLSFILDDPEFFVGENGEISRIADFVEAIFGNENVNIRELVESVDDLETFISLQDPEWIGGLLDELVQIQLLTRVIPLGVDFALYEAFGSEIEFELADRIAQALDSTSWDQEIINVGNIYQEVLKLGIEALLGDNPNYYQFVDSVAVDHMDSIRIIVNHIFEDSQVVDAAIEQASPYLIDRFIDDPDLKVLVEQALMSDPESEVVDFNFGQEISNILTMVESIYSFTTTEELTSISGMTTEAQLNLVASFGSMSATDFEAFDDAIKNMQIFERIGKAGLEYVQTSQGIDQLYIPEEVSLGDDLSSLINFAYYAANYVYTETLTTPFIEDVDFAPLFADETFRSYLLPTGENHSTLITSNIAHNLMLYAADESLSQYLVIPESLELLSPEDEAWETEINHLFGAVFDLAASFDESNALTLSVREVMELAADPMQANLSIITQFADDTMDKADQAFGGLDQSLIFRHSVSQAIETLGTQSLSFIDGYELSFPEIATDEEGIILEDMFVELIWGISTLLEDANQTLGFETIGDIQANVDNYLYIEAMNQVEDLTYETFANITILRGIISDLLLDENVQSYIRETVRNTGFVDVSDQFFAFERQDDVLSVSDISELFISAKSLQITPSFYYDPAGQIYSFLDTLTEEQLDTFFDATILKEVFTFLLTDELAIESLGAKVNEIYYNAQAGSSFLAAINPDFTNFIGSLGAIRDVEGYFDLNEIKSLIYAFNELDIRTTEDLSALADLTLANQKIEDTLVIDKLLESEWIYQHINYIFLDEAMYTDLAAIVSDQIFKQTGISHTLTKDDLSFVLPKYDMLETVGENAGKVKVSEFKEFLVAATRVNWIGEEVGAATIANLLLQEGSDGLRNIDVMTESNLIVAIFDKLLNFEYNGFGADQILADFANSKLAGNPTFDGLTFTKELLHFDTTAYDINQVIKASEIVSLVESFSVLDLSQTINLDTFITIVDNGELPDLLQSTILHSIVSNALTDTGVQGFGVNKVNSIQSIMVLPDDFFSVDYDVLMDGDLFKISELENMFIALKSLGLTDSASFSSLGIDTFTGLVDPATEDEFGDDNLDRVLNANYIYILLERALNLEDIGIYAGDLLGLNVEGEEPLDLTPPDSIKVNDPLNVVEDGRLPKEEFRRLLSSITMLGDFDALSDPAVVIDLMTSMVGAEVDPITDEDEFDRFLSSDYLYYLISVILENQDALTIPLQAYEVAGAYEGFIKKIEIRSVLDVLLILEVTAPNDIDPETITVEDLNTILSNDSSLVNYLLSQAIIDALDSNGEGLIPSYAFVDNDSSTSLLTYDELTAINQTLSDIAEASFDPDNAEGYTSASEIPILDLVDVLSDPTVGQVEMVTNTNSIILKSELTRQILLNLSYEREDLYDEMFDDDYLGIDIFTSDELDSISLTLSSLANDVYDPLNLDDDYESASDIELTVLVNLLSNPNVGQVVIIGDTNSQILKTELTKQMLLNLDYDAATMDNTLFVDNDAATGILKDIELDSIISTLSSLANDVYDPDNLLDDYESANDIELTSLVDLLSDPTVGQVEIITSTDSSILKMELTKQLLISLNYEASDLQPTIFEGNSSLSGQLTSTELDGIAQTLRDLAEDVKAIGQDASEIKINDLVDVLSDPTVGQVEIIGDTNSVILKTELTKQMLDSLNYTADDFDASLFSYRSLNANTFVDNEINHMVDTLVLLSIDVYDPDNLLDDYESSDDIELTVLSSLLSDPTIIQVEIIANTDSVVLRTEITTQLLGNLDYERTDLPVEAYENSDREQPFTKNELSSMAASLRALSENPTDSVSSINPELIKVSQIVSLKTAQDPTNTYDALDSYVIHLIVSEQAIPIVGLDSIPEDGYFNPEETILKKEVIIDIIDAIDIMAGDDKTQLITDINPANITVGQVEELHLLNRPIINNLLNREMITALTQGDDEIPADAYVSGDPMTGRLDPFEISELVAALTIIGEEDQLITDINFNAITIQQVEDVSTNQSVTIKSRITDQVLSTLGYIKTDLPDDAYEDDDSTKWFKQNQIISIAASLKAMADDPSDPVSSINPDLIEVQQVVNLKTAQDPTNTYDGLDAYIIQVLVSDQAIPILGVENIPDASYANQPDNTRLTKSSIIELIDAIDIVTVDNSTPLTGVDFDSITVGQVQQIHDLDGLLTNRLISNTIVDTIDPNDEGKVPHTAYIDDNASNNLEPAEVAEMINALRILVDDNDPLTNPDDALVSSVNTANINIGQVSQMHALNSEITAKLISDSIVDAIDPDAEGKIPLSAHIDGIATNNLRPDEVSEMIEALRILAGKQAGDPDSTTDGQVVSALIIDPTIYQVSAMHLLNSEITAKLISDSIIEAIDPLDEGKIPLSAHIDGIATNNLRPDEVSEMIEALRILAGKKVGDPDTLTDPQVVSDITVDPTIGQVKQLNALNSDITEKLISDSIIDAVGLANVPNDAYVLDTPGNLLKAAEVTEMIGALEILGADNDPLTDIDDKELDEIDTRVTVAQTQDLKVNGSVIIKQIISNSIVEMLAVDQIPNDAYRTEVGLNRLTDDEIADMIDSLQILAGGDDSVYVDSIVFDESTFTVTTLKSFPASLIMNRIISSALITNMPNLPSESYVTRLITDPEYNLDLLRVEIDNLFEALTILGIENLNNANNINAADITFDEMDQITLLGTPGSLYEHPSLAFSPVITHILSTPMVAVISDVRSGHDYGIPTTAMRNANDLLYDEVVGLVDALKLIGDVGNNPGQSDPTTTSLADITIQPDSFGPTLLDGLINLDSLVVYRMISIGIHDASIANADAYAELGDRNYDPGLPALPVLEDIEIDEMNHIVTSMNILSITSIANVASEITVAKLKALTGPEIETLVEAISDGPNTIIYYLISDVVDPDNDLFASPFGDIHYVYDGPTRVRLKRASIAAALALL